MSVASMTGFARAEGQADGYGWVWELKSVNGRGLDVRCRVPPGFDRLEGTARKAALARFKRGNLSLNLVVTRPAGKSGLRVDRDMLDQLMALHGELGDRVDPAPPRLEALLAVRGVVEPVDEVEDAAAAEVREAAMARTLEDALEALAGMRAEEGARLAEVLAGQIDGIDRLAAEAEKSAQVQPEALKARLAEQIALLLDSGPGLTEERLAQEAAILASKADVREEIDRLRAHVAAARELLAAGGAVGRKLDFLCQEFNREANTIGSKAAVLDLTRVSLELKALIDQFREQAQNVE